MSKKLKGRFGIFQHFCRKTQKNLREDPLKSLPIFRKKSHNVETKLKKGPFGIFQHPF